jgi:hypothetical protein
MGLAMVLCGLALPVANAVNEAEAVPLDAYPLATCLDGSAARYYLSRGDPNSTTWLLYLEGGSFCASEAECRKRSHGYLGTTKRDKSIMSLDEFYFSRDPLASPLLSSAHHVYIRYCDGAYYAGERHEPVLNGSLPPLYHRGKWISEAVMADLVAHRGLDKATDVVLAGCSAGAIALYAHIDAMRQRLPSSARVVGFADSGFYLDVNGYADAKKFVVAETGHNVSSLLSPQCTEAHQAAKEHCLVAQYSAQYVRTPLFAFQSRYDLDQRSNLNDTCQASIACIEEYGQNLTRRMRTWINTSAEVGVRHGAFMDGCNRHCDGAANASLPDLFPLSMQVDGVTPLQSLARWHGGGVGSQALWIQPGTYPCATCCG